MASQSRLDDLSLIVSDKGRWQKIEKNQQLDNLSVYGEYPKGERAETRLVASILPEVILLEFLAKREQDVGA